MKQGDVLRLIGLPLHRIQAVSEPHTHPTTCRGGGNNPRQAVQVAAGPHLVGGEMAWPSTAFAALSTQTKLNHRTRS